MQTKQSLKLIAGMSEKKRIEMAQKKLDTLWQPMISLIQTHANNRYLVYGNIFAKQIGKSYAAVAFNDLQDAMFKAEIVKICAFWDPVDLDKNSIPTIISLIDEPTIIEKLLHTHTTRSAWRGADGSVSRREIDLAAINFTRRIQVIEKLAKPIISSERLEKTRVFRALGLAHLMDISSPTYALQSYVPPKYGHEQRMLLQTRRVIDALSFIVNNSDFAYQDAVDHANRCAANLWENCAFNIPLR